MRYFIKQFFGLFLFILTVSTIHSAEPDWVSSFGMNTNYSLDNYLTGFAMIDQEEQDSLIKVKEIALSDLTGKIETRVYSDITLKESDGTNGYSSSSSLITRCTVDIKVSGINYEIYSGRDKLFALAFIDIKSLSNYYINNGSNLFIDITKAKERAEQYKKSGQTDLALLELYRAKTDFINFFEQYSLYSALNPQSPYSAYFDLIKGLDDIISLKTLETEITLMLEDLENSDSENFEDAIDKIAVFLKKQEITAGILEVPPFNYEQTSFSSEFGRYGSTLLESALIKRLERSSNKTIFRSNYWKNGNTIELKVLAINENGEKLAQAAVRFPYDSQLKSYDVKPQNFDESMISLREFAQGALTEGGINIDIWTNKGRDEDSPVYEKGEILQLFMRVNQPAFLQIIYHLATGQNVLLEKSFYIGIDMVNRVVKLPYEFEVQPPYGIEQLIVTAYSVEPPKANVIIEKIDGKEYEVFSSMTEVTAQSRGLSKIQNNTSNDIRVGEALLNLTTIGK